MEQVTPRHLHTAARVADALVYAAGLAGIVAGGLLLRDGLVWFGVVAWSLTFVAGAALRLAAWAARALAQLLVRTEQLAEDVRDIRAAVGPAPPGSLPEEQPPDPYRRWGHW